MQTIQKFLELNNSKSVKIAVIGDLLLDEYYDLTVNRISPEYPIPIFKSNIKIPQFVYPGGGGNTSLQLSHFNANVSVLGFLDGYSKDAYSRHGMNIRNCILLPPSGHIPLKRRLYQGQFPLCRWDIEEKDYGMKDLEKYRKRLYAFLQKDFDAIVFSDYNKGVFADKDHPDLKQLKCITVVDPKINTDIQRWFGCTVFKPNESEAKNLSGLSDWKEQADYFCQHLGCKSVVITQEGRGVVGRYNGDYFEYRPTKKIILESPIGGGDTFVAFMAMSLAYGLTLPEAVEVAFNAGAVYVGKRHNEPITPYELLRYADPIKAKIVTPNLLAEVSKNEKLNMLNGCFDGGLHLGHISCLNSAKELGGKLVVAVNSDESVRLLKGEGRPILDVQERMVQVAALECVDFVVSFDEETPYELIKKVMPAAIVKASEYKAEDVVGRDLVPVILVPYVEGYSTTKKLEKIKHQLG